MPGARTGSVAWIDAAGSLLLFGGSGRDSTGIGGTLNDLWRYDPASNEWTWMSGSDTRNQPGVYGTKGIPHPDNVPGGHEGSASWMDGSGNLVFFGGFYNFGSGGNGYLNDVWRYDPVTNMWTRMDGSNIDNQPGVYGTKGTSDAANVPGARRFGTCWTDSFGDVWLLGGTGYDSTGSIGYMNDLWRYKLTVWCSNGSDCLEGHSCIKGECQPILDNYPVLGDGPFIAARDWPLLSGSQASPTYLQQGTSILWTFSDDFASCSGACTHAAEYRMAGASEWTAIEVSSDAEAGYATVELPIEELQNAATYAFRFSVEDCAGQAMQSGEYYFRVATSDAPPQITGGPWRADIWQQLPVRRSQAPVLAGDTYFLWTFSDDYASCPGLCQHRARYRRIVDDGSWIWEWLDVETDPAGTDYAYCELPAGSMEPGDYMFRFELWDCTGQTTRSATHYFKVPWPQ